MGVVSRSTKGCFWWVLVLGIAALVVAAAVVTLVYKHKKSANGSSGSHEKAPYLGSASYSQALGLSLTFLDLQKSGKLPEDNPISWRGDSALKDGEDVGLDLSGGMYDAGDHIKFSFPMAFTCTLLSWSVLEYGAQMAAAKQLTAAKSNIKWITDYLLKTHSSSNELYFQVGDPAIDHACWQRPEDMDESRPSYILNTSMPGSEVAAEVAAAMASASLVFRKDQASYSETLVKHARELFHFANTSRDSYTSSYPVEQTYYNSTSFGDELLWAASWLYHATGEESFLTYATGSDGELYAEWDKAPAWLSWDNKVPGVQVLLSRQQYLNSQGGSSLTTTGLAKYKKTANELMCALLPDSPTATKDRTAETLHEVEVFEGEALQLPDTQGELCKEPVQEQKISNLDTPEFEDLDEQRYVPEDLHVDDLEGVQAPTLSRVCDANLKVMQDACLFDQAYDVDNPQVVQANRAIADCMIGDSSLKTALQIEALLKEECEDIFWQEEKGYDFRNSYLEGLSSDVHSVNAITNCICYDDSMECKIDAIFALHVEFYDVEVQRYLMKPIQIDKQKPIQIDEQKPIQINEQKPIQGVFHEVVFAHSTESGQDDSSAMEDTQHMDLLDDALEGFLFSSTICSSQHNEVCDLKPCTDEKDSELMQMLDEVLEDFRPSLCHDIIPREVGNVMETKEGRDAMESPTLLVLPEDLVSSDEGVYSLLSFSMMENLELLPYDLGGVADPLQVYGPTLPFDPEVSTSSLPEGSYNSDDLHLDIYQPYDSGECFGISMQTYFIFMTWDPGGGYAGDFIRHFIYMFFAMNALLMHYCLCSTTSKFLYYPYDPGSSYVQIATVGTCQRMCSDYLYTSKSSLECSGESYSPEDLRSFSISQANYLLGKNPVKMSYLVGYGSNFPQKIHHRAASIPSDSKKYACKDGFQWLSALSENPHTAEGALVGGPFQNDSFVDSRNNTMQNEPTTYNTAALVGLMAGLTSSTQVTLSTWA
ncbi:hypothetical protein L7F22_016408 [Adiantum nelumboides]|nr:hypothetical protein [Adiantum nelumboides]